MLIIYTKYKHCNRICKYFKQKNLFLTMFNLEITTLDGTQSVALPSGWHEVSYTYYNERIAPFAVQSEDVVHNNVRLVCSMLGVDASRANIMEFATILGNLLGWMEEVPEVTQFTVDNIPYNLPVLGKAQAGDKPFMTVGDWENANDAVKFLQDSDYDQDNGADVGLVLLAALARGPQEVNDIEFARRLKEWQHVNMDIILSASFFFLLFSHTFVTDTLPSLTELTKQATQLLPDITLDGLRWLQDWRQQVYLQSLQNLVQ